MDGTRGPQHPAVAAGDTVRTSDGIDVGRVVAVVADAAPGLVLALRREARADDTRVVVPQQEVEFGDGVVTLTRVTHAALSTAGWMRAATYDRERAPSRLEGEQPATAPLPRAEGGNGHD